GGRDVAAGGIVGRRALGREPGGTVVESWTGGVGASRGGLGFSHGRERAGIGRAWGGTCRDRVGAVARCVHSDGAFLLVPASAHPVPRCRGRRSGVVAGAGDRMVPLQERLRRAWIRGVGL